MKKILVLIIALALTVGASAFTLPASAKTIYTKTISLLSIRANARGEGYRWNNYDSILTLDGLNIDTKEDYGLKIMDGATVILKGTNYIKASKAAIFIEGKVIIKGDGVLILEGENGIYCSSNDPKDTLTINGGKYEMTCTAQGIVSDFHRVALNDCNVKISTSGDVAAEAQRLTVGAKTVLSANASLVGHKKLHLEGANVKLESKGAALVSGSEITFAKLVLSGGASKSSLSKLEKYNGEAFVSTSSTYDDSKRSVILGEKYPAILDAAIFAAVAVVLGCAVVLPIVIKKKKAQAAVIARDLAEEERKAEEKAKKKAAKQ